MSLPKLVSQWPDFWRERFEERSGILMAELRIDRVVADDMAEKLTRIECAEHAETRSLFA